MIWRDRVRFVLARRTFSARETAWQQQLEGLELASFTRRAAAFVLDWMLAGVLIVVLLATPILAYSEWRHRHDGEPFLAGHVHVSTGQRDVSGPPVKIQVHPNPTEQSAPAAAGDEHEGSFEQKAEASVTKYETFNHALELALPILYFGLLTWWGKGRTPGKRLLRIRVVSIVHSHLSLWHSIERALGYGAAALEGGFGFAQYFIHPYRRCVQDRIAETIVVTERSYRALERKRAAEPLAEEDEEREAAPGPPADRSL